MNGTYRIEKCLNDWAPQYVNVNAEVFEPHDVTMATEEFGDGYDDVLLGLCHTFIEDLAVEMCAEKDHPEDIPELANILWSEKYRGHAIMCAMKSMAIALHPDAGNHH